MQRWAVYSGGNGFGAFQAGVNEYINEKKGYAFFDQYCGISAGAINAAAGATGMIPEASHMWRNIEESQIIKRRSLLKFAGAVLAGRVLPWADKQTGFYDTSPLRETLRDFFAMAKIKKPLYVGRVDLFTGQYVDNMVGYGTNIYDAVWRSTIIPIMMKADVQNTALWVDGGIHNARPLSRVVEDGESGDHVFLINAVPNRKGPKQMKQYPKRADVIDVAEATITYLVEVAAINDMRSFMDRNQIPGYKSFATTVIEPTIDLGNGSDYSIGIMRKRFDHGYARAESVLGW